MSLILKNASATCKIEFETTTGGDIDAMISWAEYTDSATSGSPQNSKVVQRTTAGTSTLLAATSGTVSQLIKHMNWCNVDSSLSTDVKIRIHDGTTLGQLKIYTLAPGQSISYEDGRGWGDVQSTSAVPTVTFGHLNTQHDNSTTTPTSVTDFTKALTAGTYKYELYLRFQAAATTTGIKFSANFTGTTGSHVQWWRWSDNSATAATAAVDQDAVAATGQVMGVMAGRVNNTAGLGTTISVDTANADCFGIFEGLLVVTGSGNFEFYHGSEVAALTSLMVGSCLVLTKMN